MATGIANLETVMHRATSGDVLVRNIDITGWSAPGKKLNEFSQNGRLWGEVVGGVVNLYRSVGADGVFDAGERVMTGAAAENDLVTLAEDNASGLSGFLRYTGSGKFDIIFTHASEEDVLEKIPGESQQLVWSVIEPELNGPRRLEGLLNDAMRKVSNRLVRDVQDVGVGTFVRDSDGNAVGEPFPIDLLGRYELAVIANPEQLREILVWTLLLEAAEKLLGSNEFATTVQKKYAEKWQEEWGNLRLWIDAEADLQQDGNRRASPTTYKPRRR